MGEVNFVFVAQQFTNRCQMRTAEL